MIRAHAKFRLPIRSSGFNRHFSNSPVPFSIFVNASKTPRSLNCGFPISRNTSKRYSSKANTAKPSRAGRRILIAASLAAVIYATDEFFLASSLQRSTRAVYVFLMVAYKYVNSSSYSSMEELHEETSRMIFSMIRANKGLYIKLGQAVANQGSVFPMAYQKRFATLYDDAPNDSWASIDAMLRSALGPNYEKEVFETIDHQPIASASIAQVHHARLKQSGEEVAVKVQHPYISRQIHFDLAVYRLVSRVYSQIFDLPLSFFTSYISEQLLKEADFAHELSNSSRFQELIENDPSARSLDIHVPINYREYSSQRILVTEWVSGISLTDKQRLIDHKISLPRLMHQYMSIFARQIFDYGFVHSDPHPGNMLARMHNGIQQLVILDHGLYIELPDKFKSEYRDLWKTLFTFDSAKIYNLAEEWGIKSPELLQSIVQLRPPPKTKAENAPNSIEILRLFFGDKDKFPQDLLFISRTMRMMQNMNQSLGSPVNRINLLTKVALDADKNNLASISDWYQHIRVRISLLFSDLIFMVLRARQVLKGDRYGDKGEGLEDYIEQYMRENAKAFGIELADSM